MMDKVSTTVTLDVETYLELREKARCADDPNRIVHVEHPIARMYTSYGRAWASLPKQYTYVGKDDLLQTVSAANKSAIALAHKTLAAVRRMPKRYQRCFDRHFRDAASE